MARPRKDPSTPKPPRTLATGGGDATASGVNFQQSLGALFGLWMLTEGPIDHRLQRGGVKVTAIGMETEAPLDDALAVLSDGGVICAQAKNTLSLSASLTSEFGKTVEQIVRQWRFCRAGSGDRLWNRPLDTAKDRLLMAVGPGSPATTRVHLARGLDARRQPGTPILTLQETEALAKFDTCLRLAWTAATSDALTDAVIHEMSRLTYVHVIDPGGADRAAWEAQLAPALAQASDAPIVLNLLERLAGDLMSQRAGRKLQELRADLIGRGARLTARPDFRDDIAALAAASLQTAQTLSGLEVIEVQAGTLTGITRRCQAAVNAAALGGNLLLIGEPGAGKSGVINALGRALRDQQHDVVALAVDRFSVQSLEGLTQALGLKNDLPAVLAAWDGPGPAFLLIDALDASRGGPGEAAFKRLIEAVIEQNGRWMVVATIRTFDLRLGRSFRTLFKGDPPDRDLREAEFAGVRHLRVPVWSPAEFDELLALSPPLTEVLQNAPAKLRELAMVPFNTRLLAELIKDGAVSQDFSAIDTQTALLDLYWEQRIQRHGVAAEVCLQNVVDEMVAQRALKAPRLKVAAGNPGALEALVGDGVLVEADQARSVQFRHHLLFDYVASRVFLNAEAVVSGAALFPRAEASGLVLAPAMGFLLQSLWSRDADRSGFWKAVSQLLGAEDSDPVLRSVAARMAAELPTTAEDVRAFAAAINAGEDKATAALPRIAGAVAVRLEDDSTAAHAPWVGLDLELSEHPAQVAGVLRMMGFMLVGRLQDEALKADLGTALRALLAYAYGLEDSRVLATPVIGLVADTLVTDPAASVAMLREILTDTRFDRFAAEELPAVARKINAIAPVAPDFTAEVYAAAYARDVTDTRPTPMGTGGIVNLTSSPRQDFEMARYSLKEYFPTYLAASPVDATRALLAAIAGFVQRQHPPSDYMTERSAQVSGFAVRLQPDHSYIWAREAHPDYTQDADALLSLFETFLETGDEAAVLAAAAYAAQNAWLAVVWSRLFMAAAARGGALAALLRPYAMRPTFVIETDTRKDAIDLASAQYDELSSAERAAFETEVLAESFDHFAHPEAARDGLLRSLFGAIGADRLATDAARQTLTQVQTDERINPRLFELSPRSIEPNEYYWMDAEVRTLPAVGELITAFEAVRDGLGAHRDDNPPIESLANVLAMLTALKARLDADTVPDVVLVRRAEGTFAQGVHKLVSSAHLDANTPATTVELLTAWITDACAFASPEVEANTEEQFEAFGGWSSPAARLEAAEAALDLVQKRPEAYSSLGPLIDEMLQDPHPAVRLNAALRLIRLWDLDRQGFWDRARRLLATEPNRGVVDLFLAAVLGRALAGTAPREVADLVLPLNAQFPETEPRNNKIRQHVVQLTLQFWLHCEFEDAGERVRSWVAATMNNVEAVLEAVQWLRAAFTDGLRGQTDTRADAHRRLAIDLMAQAVQQAAAELESYPDLNALSEAETVRARDALRIIDAACQQLYFSSGAFAHGAQQDQRPPLTPDTAAILLHETAPTLRLIGQHGGPHTLYHLIQLLEHLVEADPPGVFDLIAFAVLRGGRQTGYQFESLAADLMVTLVGRYLADHKEVFDDPQRRLALVDTLETFVAAGWPAVHRLFYRLPELLK